MLNKYNTMVVIQQTVVQKIVLLKQDIWQCYQHVNIYKWAGKNNTICVYCFVT